MASHRLALIVSVGALTACPSSPVPTHSSSVAAEAAASSGKQERMLPSITPATGPTPIPTMTAPQAKLTGAPVTPAQRAADAVGERTFGVRLFSELSKKEKGNLFVSPASARFALSMLLGGARGQTAKELEGVLGANAHTHDVAAALGDEWAALAVPSRPDDWAKNEAITLRTANRLFAQKGQPLQPGYVELTKTRYGAPIEAVDFLHDSEGARRIVNDWVAARTEQRIKDIVPPPLPSDTKLVLANAIYFKAAWDKAFEESNTRPEPFFASGGAASPVPMMHSTASRRFGETNDVQLVELPYGAFDRNDITMLVIVPKKKDGLVEVEKALSPELVATWIATARAPTEVNVALPKFRIESSLSLGSTLEALGAPSVFHYGRSDLSGIDGTHDLFVGLVLQKTFVAVDEKGTEAAAATVVMARAGGPPHAPPKPIEVRADRPFLFVIRDAVRDRMLFVGRVTDPK